MKHYYNEIDPYCAQWLRNLMLNGFIPFGDVDERSIVDVKADDLRGYTQCHFFAGLGGWPYALRLAGWPEDRPVWTGSCPCQPFSVAGLQAGFDDPRHLWPHFLRLIAERLPTNIFGEQVAGATDWLRLVRSDLEAVGYAVGAIPMEAASASAEHYRDRYWFVAHHDREQSCEGWLQRSGQQRRPGSYPQSDACVVPDKPRERGHGLETSSRPTGGSISQEPCRRDVPHNDGIGSQIALGELGDAGAECAAIAGDNLRSLVNDKSLGWGEGWTEHEFRSRGFTAAVASIDGSQYVECPDGKWRRLPPPRVRWLGNGIPARVAKLRALGNAIDPRPAAKFISAYLEAETFT